jgi:hypothetical protein
VYVERLAQMGRAIARCSSSVKNIAFDIHIHCYDIHDDCNNVVPLTWWQILYGTWFENLARKLVKPPMEADEFRICPCNRQPDDIAVYDDGTSKFFFHKTHFGVNV